MPLPLQNFNFVKPAKVSEIYSRSSCGNCWKTTLYRISNCQSQHWNVHRFANISIHEHYHMLPKLSSIHKTCM